MAGLEDLKPGVSMKNATHIHAVLTGDLVKSLRLRPEQSQSAMSRIRELGKEFESVFRGSTVGHVDTFRHDSWQWLLTEPTLALRAAVFMRAGLRVLSEGTIKFDTRVAIGIGTVEIISKKRVSDSRGPAFTLSGKALDAMKNCRMSYAVSAELESEADWVSNGIVPLLDCIVTEWTAAEARAVHSALLGLTQEQTAERWPVLPSTGKKPTRQAVRDSLHRAHWAAVESVLDWIEKFNKKAFKLANV